MLTRTTSTVLAGLALTAVSSAQIEGVCAFRIRDQAQVTPGDCLEASSVPTFGMLYPMSGALNVDLADQVGMGVFAPNSRLHVNGDGIGGEDLFRVQRNGSTRLFLSADGNLGVGAFFTPSTALSVMGHANSVNDEAALARALEGYVSDPAGASSNFGIIGFSEGAASTAIRGRAMSPTGSAVAVYGDSLATDGIGVLGEHRNSGGVAPGVEGNTNSTVGLANGVLGIVNSTAPGGSSAGVRGQNNGTGGLGIGVYGSQDGSGWGVYGTAASGGLGVAGFAPSGGTAVHAFGDFSATGVKAFVQPHPSDASKEIAFVCLEGNESGTYCRGEGSFVDGLAIVAVPEDFRLVSEAEGLTIQTTAVGGRADIWVESIDLDQVVLRADADVSFHYFLNGVRRGFADHTTIRENRSFRPRQGGAALGQDLPPAARDLLVQNGILNPDHSLNLDTAARLGWDVPQAVTVPKAHVGNSPLPTAKPVILEEK